MFRKKAAIVSLLSLRIRPAMAILPPGILARVFQIRLCNSLQQRGLSSSSSGIRFLVEECGIPLNPSSPLSKKIRFEEEKSSNVKSVIAFFKSHEFSEAEIARLILRDPLIIHRSVASNLSPKLQYLIESGFKGSLLRQMVFVYPRIFHHGLSSTVKRAPDILKTVLRSDENVCAAISRVPMLLWSRNLESRMKLNVEYLTQQGMPNDRVVRLILLEPIILIHINKKLVKLVEKVKELGVMPHDPMFLHGVRVMIRSYESTWERKVDMFKRFGWSDKDVASTFARQPNCFKISEEKLKTAMEYFVNYMEIPRQVIIADPVVLTCSLKERIRPRCGVVKILEAEGLLPNWFLSTILRLTEKEFIRKYIRKHQDAAPHLLEAYDSIKKSDVREEELEMNALSHQQDEDVVCEH